MKKIEILHEPFALSDKEIASYKEFEAIMDRRNASAIKKDVFNKIWKAIGLTVGFTLICSLGYYYLNTPNVEPNKVNNKETFKEQLSDSISYDNALDSTSIVKKNRMNEKEISQPNPAEKSNVRNQHPSKSDTKGIPKAENNHHALLETDKNENEESMEPLATTVEEEYEYLDAFPVNGVADLYEYFYANLKYPDSALKDSIEGDVIVSFTIFKSGQLGNIIIEKSLGHSFDEETERLILNMPPWHPASVNGQPVDSRISVPLHFEIDN